MSDPGLPLFRHTLATLAYRTSKTMRGAPPEFADLRPGPTSKTSVEIVAHMGDLIEWSLKRATGDKSWTPHTPQEWDAECERFFGALERFDAFLASGETIHCELSRILQGPISDALTHTGQLAMLRRLAGSPIKGESYIVADVVVGRVGSDQTPPGPKKTFD